MDLLLRDMSTFCGKKTVAQTIQLNKRPLIMQENFCLSTAPILKKEGTADQALVMAYEITFQF